MLSKIVDLAPLAMIAALGGIARNLFIGILILILIIGLGLGLGLGLSFFILSLVLILASRLILSFAGSTRLSLITLKLLSLVLCF